MIVFNGTNVSMAVVWLIAMAVFLIVEGIVPGLVSIWFAVGALAALVAAMVGAPLWLQLVWFVLVSIAALALTRPLSTAALRPPMPTASWTGSAWCGRRSTTSGAPAPWPWTARSGRPGC